MNKNILGAPFEQELVDKEKVLQMQMHRAEENRTEEYDESNGRKLKNIEFIPIEFDYKNYKTGERQVNQALERGYAVIDNFKTESGVVMVMGLYRSRHNE